MISDLVYRFCLQLLPIFVFLIVRQIINLIKKGLFKNFVSIPSLSIGTSFIKDQHSV